MNTGKERGGRDKKNRLLGWLQLVLAIVFIGGAFWVSRFLASLSSPPAPERYTEQRELLVETARIQPRSHRLRFSNTGTVQVRALTDLVPQVGGRVVEIDDDAFPGGLVTPETVLFRIEDTDYHLNVEEIMAEVARAETRVELQQAGSEASIAEWRRLNPNTRIPPLVAEEPQLAEAKANLQAAQARLKIARLNLSRTEFTLPFTGRVTEFSLEIGQYVTAGQSYGKAYRLASLEIDLPMEKQHLDWLLEAEAPVITVSRGSSREHRAFVKRIAGTVDEQTRLYRVMLGIEDHGGDMVPGLFVKVNIVGPERPDIWLLPIEVLQENRVIWTVTPENTLRRIQPEILQITDEYVMAQSDGSTITVVRGNIPEATENTPVRLVETTQPGIRDHGG